MRRTTYVMMALALVLGFSQCKKEQTPANNASEGVRITLNVDGGASTGSATGGSRAEVNPPHVSFVNGDQILVASGGKYVGTLTRTEDVFSGNISDPVEGQPLYFYFLGNKQGTLETNATSCTVNISDQTTSAGLPVISMGKSAEDYDESVTSYSSCLYNKCSLMKFNVTTPSTAAICITGMNNTVTVEFSDPTDEGFEYGKDGDGVIKMPAKDENNVTWAIVLPQEALAVGAEGSVYTDDNACTGTRPAMDAIEMNKYLDEGVALTVNTAAFNALTTPLTFEARTAGVSVGLDGEGPTLEYSTDGGVSWTNWTNYSSITLDNAGDKVSFRGDNADFGYASFTCSGQCYIYGNVMSILNSNGFATLETITEGGALNGIFYGTDIDIPADKDLVLPATTLAESCYSFMFCQCSGLTKAPELPATSLAYECYGGMFENTGLTTAPELPATTLAENCYNAMFCYCKSLTTAPELPATTLVSGCYANMFRDCSNLNSITCLATEGIDATEGFSIFGPSTTETWVINVAASGTFKKANGAEWPSGWSGIPDGWTVEEQ